jgi:hypothetical protein
MYSLIDNIYNVAVVTKDAGVVSVDERFMRVFAVVEWKGDEDEEEEESSSVTRKGLLVQAFTHEEAGLCAPLVRSNPLDLEERWQVIPESSLLTATLRYAVTHKKRKSYDPIKEGFLWALPLPHKNPELRQTTTDN